MNETNNIRKAMGVFEQVCDLPPAERSAALDEHCKDDAELRRRVERMLATEDDDRAVLAESKHGAGVRIISEHLIAEAPAEKIPDRIDRYHVIREIGRGGMGVVYEAQQDSPKRRVALKLIHAADMSPNLIKRFEREAFALGQLQHPGIAHIYESGTAKVNGRHQPFLAMELIDGERITTHVKNQAIEVRARLELVARVCDAVQHAHQKGVIHRDLKPANILVSEQGTQSGTGTGGSSGNSVVADTGQPKILDFGVARLTDSDVHAATMQTDPGQIVGTLAYMSPEQVVGDPQGVDTRSDVYALGVVLFQLLADRLPLDLSNKTVAEAARIIRDEEPESLSSVDRSLRGDIETIVAKALEKEPERRYASAAELAADLRRYLRDEPITARPASAIYNLRKFARRNKGLVGGLVATFVVLLLGTAGTTIGLVSALQANSELEITNTALADANRELEETNRALEQSNDDLEKVSEFQSAQLTGIDVPAMGLHIRSDLFESVPEDRMAYAEIQFADVNYTDVARSALSEFIFDRALRTIDEEFADQPLLQARLFQDVATVLRRLGILEKAVEPQHRALEFRRNELGDDDPDTIASLEQSGLLLQDLGDFDLAETHYRDAWAANRRVHGERHPESIRGQTNLAAIQYAKSDWDAAEESARAALSDMAKLEKPNERNTLYTMSVLASILISQSEYKEAEQLMRETLSRRRTLLGDEHRSTLLSIANLGSLLEQIGKYDEAKTFTEEALAINRQLLGEDHPQTILSSMNLSNILVAQGKLTEAEPIMRDVVARRRRLLGTGHPNTQTSVNNLASVLDEMGKYEEAEALYREALASFRETFGDDHPNTLRALGNLGFVINQQGKNEEAEPYYRESLAGFRKAFGMEHQLTLSATGNLAALLSELGKHDEAEPLYYESLEGRRKLLGEEHPSTLNATFNMGYMLRSKGKYEEAELLCTQALEGYQRIGGDDHIGTLYSLAQMGDLRMEQDRPAEAEDYYRTVLDRRRRINGDDHPQTITAVGNLADAHEALSRWGDAEPLRRTLVEAASQGDQIDKLRLAHRRSELAENLIHQDRHAEAEDLLVQCMAIYRESELPDHWRRWNAQSLLGDAIAADPERREEAESLMLDAAENITTPSDASYRVRRRLAQTPIRLIEHYKSVGEKVKAAEWQNRVDANE